MVRHFVFAVALLMPIQATALSCPAIEPVDALNEARLQPDWKVVGYGTFQTVLDQIHLERDLPDARSDQDGSGLRLALPIAPKSRARFFNFTGVLFKGDKIVPVDQQAIMDIWCDNLWCGRPFSFEQDVGYLVTFSRSTPEGQLSIDSGPCSFVFTHKLVDPDLNKISRCLAQGTCTAGDLGL